MSGSAGSGRYAHIDALRAAAVMLVVVAHAGAGEVVPGGSGVTIFFSISGFIITYLVLRERERSGRFAIGPFYLRRALKIVPPFVVIVLAPTAVYALSHHVDLDGLLAQVLFFYNWTIITVPPEVLPGSRVVWSLSVEEQFYVFFALFWLVASQRRNAERWLVWTAVAAIVYSEATKIRLAADAHANEQRIEYGSDTRMDGIALGVLCAVLFVRWSRGSQQLAGLRRALSSQWTLPAAAAIYLFTLVWRDDVFRATARFPLQSLAACMVILFGFLAAEGWARRAFDVAVRLRAVQAVGLASYSIYLVHFILDRALIGAVEDLPLPVEVTLLTLGGVAVGMLVYRFVELPFARLRSRLHEPGDPAAGMTEASAGLGVGVGTTGQRSEQ